MRALWVALVVLALVPAVAFAQEESPTPEPSPTVAPEAPDDACQRGGADADYVYCDQDDSCVEGADSDYVYDVECFPSAGEGDDESGGGGPPPAPRALPAAQLPLTGGEPLVIALLGAAFVLLGAGLRPRGAASS